MFFKYEWNEYIRCEWKILKKEIAKCVNELPDANCCKKGEYHVKRIRE